MDDKRSQMEPNGTKFDPGRHNSIKIEHNLNKIKQKCPRKDYPVFLRAFPQHEQSAWHMHRPMNTTVLGGARRELGPPSLPWRWRGNGGG